TQLDDLETDEELEKFANQLKDRFGPIPSKVEALFVTIKCRRKAKELGFEKLILKNQQLRLYFISDPDSAYFESDTFQSIMTHIQTSINKARLKQVGKNFMLIVDGIRDMNQVYSFFERISQ